jgi:hypothetical protein
MSCVFKPISLLFFSDEKNIMNQVYHTIKSFINYFDFLSLIRNSLINPIYTRQQQVIGSLLCLYRNFQVDCLLINQWIL